jgi:hypothetical protein
MRAFKATYKKVGGDIREITFMLLVDVPKQILSEDVQNNRIKQTDYHIYENGQELVYDLDKKGIRTINWNTIQGAVQEVEVPLHLRNIK